MPDPIEHTLIHFRGWYDNLPTYSASGGAPARGTVAAALWVLERLREEFSLDLQSHLASGRAQIKGISPSNVSAVLKRYGETRPFLKEGGRTNRGVPGAIGTMLDALDAAGIEQLPQGERSRVLDRLQQFLVERVCEYHGRQRIKPVFNPAETTWQFVAEVLEKAQQTGKRGPVAQHLVGAKLELRFPETEIRSEPFSAADDPGGQPGDFHIGDTAFHVTVAPSQGHYEKCKHNLRQGLRVFLFVTEDRLVGARQIVEQEAPRRVAVESVETFVAQNIEEPSQFPSSSI